MDGIPAKYFVAIAGNIGVGKSTLTRLLAERLGWEPFVEAFEENPYLADFYADMSRWSFHSQIFFLTMRLQQHFRLLQSTRSVIQDRTVYEDVEIFAHNLFAQGYMQERDWRMYYQIYQTLALMLRPPNLVVYLRASDASLAGRIAQRGRDYELTASREYLASLNVLYDDWAVRFSLCPLLTIETDNLNYVQNDDHLGEVTRRILARLQGKDHLRFN